MSFDPKRRRIEEEERKRQELIAETLNPPFPYGAKPLDFEAFDLLDDPPAVIDTEQE
jgi:hypothetical protein